MGARDYTVFAHRVYRTADYPHALLKKSTNRKLGRRILRGRWRGCPIYTLTLPEYSTCPPSCVHLQRGDCYGNAMPWAHRIDVDASFPARIASELKRLSDRHPGGFAVRLHVLGDFPSVAYANMWARYLGQYPRLRVFGYTAHAPESPIGRVISTANSKHADRWVVRWSGRAGALGALEESQTGVAFTCPEQAGRVRDCGSCALCWESTKSVRFLNH